MFHTPLTFALCRHCDPDWLCCSFPSSYYCCDCFFGLPTRLVWWWYLFFNFCFLYKHLNWTILSFFYWEFFLPIYLSTFVCCLIFSFLFGAKCICLRSSAFLPIEVFWFSILVPFIIGIIVIWSNNMIIIFIIMITRIRFNGCIAFFFYYIYKRMCFITFFYNPTNSALALSRCDCSLARINGVVIMGKNIFIIQNVDIYLCFRLLKWSVKKQLKHSTTMVPHVPHCP